MKREIKQLMADGAYLEALKMSSHTSVPLGWSKRIIEIIIEAGDEDQMRLAMTDIIMTALPNELAIPIVDALPVFEVDNTVGNYDDEVSVERRRIGAEMKADREKKKVSLKERKKRLRDLMRAKKYAKAKAMIEEFGLEVPATYAKATSGYSRYLKRLELDRKQAERVKNSKVVYKY